MSKKNKKSTKRAQHDFDVQREKLEVVKKQLKVQKKQQKVVASKDTPKKKLKQKGIRIRKGVRIRGIKITDAASKKKARDTLEAEAALRKMDVESNLDWEEAEGSDEEQMES
ncbi:hypothetical protein CVIRNUC_006058 [Coccomyxa viridis]|uniref:Uncharacterized protein n=1 Tax=Coccomyxa viridis TaxID=1274662 RepID=A0AAV1IAK5_9CHLO|nr:hypothetical protein CVIRNUC_006058 [Coccomyxa viridis]